MNYADRKNADRRKKRLVAWWLTSMLGVSGVTAAEPEILESPRPTMRAVFQEMKELIPLSLDENRWNAPGVREQVLASLERLERLIVVLEHHGRDRAAGFSELAMNLAGDIRETHERYRRGDY